MTTPGYFLTPHDFRELEQISIRLAHFASIIFDQAIEYDEALDPENEIRPADSDQVTQSDSM